MSKQSPGAKQADPPADDLGNKPCPPGSYCLAGTTTPTSCPLGMFPPGLCWTPSEPMNGAGLWSALQIILKHFLNCYHIGDVKLYQM